MRRRSILAGAAVAAAITASGTGSALAHNKSGFKTGQPSMLTPVMPGVTVTPLLTVGDRLRSGYRFEAIPDGISVRTRGHGRVDLYVNHETSKVPFPYNSTAPTAANGENDFDNAQVSKLLLSQHSAGVLNGSFAISSRSGYQRFCSNYLATVEGGVRPRDPLHERGDTGLRVPAGGVVASADRAARLSRRPAWSSRST